MDTYLLGQILEALGQGNVTKVVGYGAIFMVIWLEVRGLKKQFKILNTTISNSFAAGEKRFETIENDVHQIRSDLDTILQPKGGSDDKSLRRAGPTPAL